MIKILHNVFALILFTSCIAAAQVNPMKYDGTYEPEFKALYDHLQKTIVSPASSYGNDINGVVYARFLLDGKGLIIPASIKIIEGLGLSANFEVIKALKLFRKPLPFGSVDEHGERSCVLPVRFKFKASNGAQLPSRVIPLPLTTVVLKKELNATNANWKVYAKPGLNGVVGEISPGDSVTVTAWAARSFFIQARRLSGYITWNALSHDGNMQQIAQIVKERSDEEESIEEAARTKREQHVMEVLHNYTLNTAHLSLKSNKQKVYVGECATVTLAFNLAATNKVPLQFYELGSQLREYLDTLYSKVNAFNVSANVTDIEGRPEMIDGVEYTTYDIYKGSVCPLESTPVKLNAMRLKMVIVNRMQPENNKIGEFVSKPVVIQIQPKPTTPSSSFQPTGQLISEESLTSENGLVAGKPFLYHFSISGDAVLLPLDPPRPKVDGLDIVLEYIDDSDTIRDEILHSRKTFTYRVLARSAGTYNLKNSFSVSYFNTKTGKIEKLSSEKTFTVSSGESSGVLPLAEHFYSMNHCILFDASTSMQIEDYQPTRLQAVKLGLLEFLSRRSTCDIGIFAFSRYVANIPLREDSICYDQRAIYEQSVLPKQGTAIGNAICIVRTALKPDAVGRKIVVIGDGDNTTGPIGIQYAIEYAKRSNIKIYTIGVGKKGLVPYGVDAQGNPNLVADTFNDKDFQRLSKSTGGKYFYAKDNQSIARILEEIFR